MYKKVFVISEEHYKLFKHKERYGDTERSDILQDNERSVLRHPSHQLQIFKSMINNNL